MYIMLHTKCICIFNSRNKSASIPASPRCDEQLVNPPTSRAGSLPCPETTPGGQEQTKLVARATVSHGEAGGAVSSRESFAMSTTRLGIWL